MTLNPPRASGGTGRTSRQKLFSRVMRAVLALCVLVTLQ